MINQKYYIILSIFYMLSCHSSPDINYNCPPSILTYSQEGVCKGSHMVCNNDRLVDPNYQDIPTYETNETKCDGLDNDCDGKTDENLNQIELVDRQDGVCQNKYKTCLGKQGFFNDYQNISNYYNEDIFCDDQDNDCDGLIDESIDLKLLSRQIGVCQGLKEICSAGELIDISVFANIENVENLENIPNEYQSIESKCDGLDNDCDGNIDENLENIPLITNQRGVCRDALKTCVGPNGFMDQYQTIIDYQETENHCDGLDNDCDGNIDENITLPLLSNQKGVCLDGKKICDGLMGYIDRYDLILDYQETENRCDGLDNDCDGKIDELISQYPLATNQKGVCFGSLKICHGLNGFIDDYNEIAQYENVERSCDHLDNDCDGKLDENIQNCCGNGLIERLETCDDGNLIESDQCLRNCQLARCGDGFVQAGVEECDDGNMVNNDSCTSNCRIGKCGDGIVMANVEACDDGNLNNFDNCTIFCAIARCGDGFVQANETCDDGNTNNTDNCTNTCTLRR